MDQEQRLDLAAEPRDTAVALAAEARLTAPVPRIKPSAFSSCMRPSSFLPRRNLWLMRVLSRLTIIDYSG
jgi:hypothetical protein